MRRFCWYRRHQISGKGDREKIHCSFLWTKQTCWIYVLHILLHKSMHHSLIFFFSKFVWCWQCLKLLKIRLYTWCSLYEILTVPNLTVLVWAFYLFSRVTNNKSFIIGGVKPPWKLENSIASDINIFFGMLFCLFFWNNSSNNSSYNQWKSDARLVHECCLMHYSTIEKSMLIPARIYLLKVNNRTRRCEICSKLTIKTPDWRLLFAAKHICCVSILLEKPIHIVLFTPTILRLSYSTW